MMIRYIQGEGVILVFQNSEYKVVLSILHALQRVQPLAFIADAIRDIERDYAPKRIPMRNYMHLCRRCFRMVDEREDNAFHTVMGKDDKWTHRACLPVKENRP